MLAKTCYLDLDGVIVDFDSGARKLHNLDIPYEELTWDWPSEKTSLSPEEFWGKFGYDFWLGLNWTAEGKGIIELVSSLFGDNIAIVTSPPRTPGAVEGKLDWVRANLGSKWARRTFVGARKELLAASNKLLIDDRQENLDKFKANGGYIAPVGRPWNNFRNVEVLGLTLHNLEQDIQIFLEL